MDSIFQNNAAASIPTKPTGLKSVGHPMNGSKSGGLPATDIGTWWYFMVTQEIVNAIKGAAGGWYVTNQYHEERAQEEALQAAIERAEQGKKVCED